MELYDISSDILYTLNNVDLSNENVQTQEKYLNDQLHNINNLLYISKRNGNNIYFNSAFDIYSYYLSNESNNSDISDKEKITFDKIEECSQYLHENLEPYKDNNISNKELNNIISTSARIINEISLESLSS